MRSIPLPLAPPPSRVGVLPGAEMEHPRGTESIPLDRVRKKGKKEAAPAATKQDTQGKGPEGTEKGKWEEERKSSRQIRRTENEP